MSEGRYYNGHGGKGEIYSRGAVKQEARSIINESTSGDEELEMPTDPAIDLSEDRPCEKPTRPLDGKIEK